MRRAQFGPGRAPRSVRLATVLVAAGLVAGCSSGGQPGVSVAPSPTVDDATCASTAAPLQHQSPTIEALLPAKVLGRATYRWSVVGRCWLALTVGAYPGGVDGFLASLQGSGSPIPLNLDHLVYGVDGRVDTTADPPYFVYAAARPQDPAEVELAMLLLFGGASFVDVQTAPDLSQYDERTIAGKDVYVGTPAMVEQTSHQRGRPYLHETSDWMFLVISDSDAWATDALSQLP